MSYNFINEAYETPRETVQMIHECLTREGPTWPPKGTRVGRNCGDAVYKTPATWWLVRGGSGWPLARVVEATQTVALLAGGRVSLLVAYGVAFHWR